MTSLHVRYERKKNTLSRHFPGVNVKEHSLGALKHAEQMWEKEMRGMPILLGPLDWKTTDLLGVPHYVILTEKFCFLTACHVCAEIPDSFGSVRASSS